MSQEKNTYLSQSKSRTDLNSTKKWLPGIVVSDMALYPGSPSDFIIE